MKNVQVIPILSLNYVSQIINCMFAPLQIYYFLFYTIFIVQINIFFHLFQLRQLSLFFKNIQTEFTSLQNKTFTYSHLIHFSHKNIEIVTKKNFPKDFPIFPFGTNFTKTPLQFKCKNFTNRYVLFYIDSYMALLELYNTFFKCC